MDKPSKKRPRQRPDRAEKIQRRKTLRMITIKCALRGCVRPTDVDVAGGMVNAIKKRVEAFSRRVVNASLAMSGIVKGLFGGHLDELERGDLRWMANVPIPGEIFTQTFIRQLLLGTDKAKLPNQTVLRYHQVHPQLLLPGQRFLGDRNIYSAGAIKYLTNLKVGFREQIDHRIKTAVIRVSKVLGLSKQEGRIMRYRINGWKLPPRFGLCLPQPEAADDVVRLHRRMLGLGAGRRIDKKWMKADANLPHMLRYNAFLNATYKFHDIKLFDIVPVCKVKAHYIQIDTSVLYGVMQDAGAIGEGVSADNFDALRDVFWAEAFSLKRLKPRGSEFACSVVTDGISLCSTFEKVVAVDATTTSVAARTPTDAKTSVAARATNADYEPSDGDVVVGNDPGRINIYYMAGLQAGVTKVATLTRRQYYAESGINGARVRTERWTRGVQGHLDAMSAVSTKGVSQTAHEWFLHEFYIHRDALWSEYLKPRWARQRLSLYGGKKRVFARFFNRLIRLFAGGRLVVAYGNGTFAPGGVGEQSVPTTRAYKECASRVATYTIDEFRTSKVDYRDDSVLQKIVMRDGRGFPLRGLLVNTEQDDFVSRDLNAALNMRRCLVDPRPAILRRMGVVQPLQQAVVKWLSNR